MYFYCYLHHIIAAITKVVAECTIGKTIVELATIADKYIMDQTKKALKGERDEDDKPLQKGIAFPTSIAINECVGNFSPEATETRKIEDGDVVKMLVDIIYFIFYCFIAFDFFEFFNLIVT